MPRFIAILIVVAGALIAAPILGGAQTEPSPATGGQSVPPPRFHFGFALDDAGKIRQVLVYRDDQQAQSLDSCTGEGVPRENGVGELSRTDYNFDGFLDITLRVSFDPQMENSSYCIWLFDSQTQRFVLSPQLSHMTNPQPDPETKLVLARKNADCMGHCYVQDAYAWSEGQLKLVREDSEDEDLVVSPVSQCRWVHTVKVEKNGRLKEISRQRVDAGGVMCEPHAVDY